MLEASHASCVLCLMLFMLWVLLMAKGKGGLHVLFMQAMCFMQALCCGFTGKFE